MNTLVLTLLLTGAFTLMSTDNRSTATAPDADKQEQSSEGALIHTVYFWFTDDVTESRKADFKQALETLKNGIDEVQMGWIGVPGPTEARDVIDNSYDFGITFIFNSVEDEAAYQVHPVHTAFVENNSELWSRVQVYDTLVSGE